MDSPVIETQEAQETAAKVKKPLDPRVQYYLRIIGTLFVITAIVAVLLSLVNMVTRPMINTHAEEKRVAALSKVMPDADFEPVTHLPEGIDGLVSITKATRNGSPAGCCVQITTNGFGGSLELMVGVDGNGAVTGVDILSHAETLNTNRHGWLLEQYPGHSGKILVSKTSADSSHIQAISGATVTSNGVTRGVNNALKAAEAYQKGGLS